MVAISGIGRVLQKKESETKNGSFVLYLTIGSNGYNSKNKEKTNIVLNCSFFGKLAETISKYIVSTKETDGKNATSVFYAGTLQYQEENKGYINNYVNLSDLQVANNGASSSNKKKNRKKDEDDDELKPEDDNKNNNDDKDEDNEDDDIPF